MSMYQEPLLDDLFSYEDREAWQKSEEYQTLLRLWNEAGLDTVKGFGDRKTMLRTFHVRRRKEGANCIGRKEWALFYLSSGRKRQSKLRTQKGGTKPNTGKTTVSLVDADYGRTLKDLQAAAKKLKGRLSGVSLQVNDQQLLNFVFNRVVERPYAQYIQVLNTRDYLRKTKKDCDVTLIKDEEASRYDVDLLVCTDQGEILHAVCVLAQNETVSASTKNRHRQYADPAGAGIPVVVVHVLPSGAVL